MIYRISYINKKYQFNTKKYTYGLFSENINQFI